MPTGPASSIFVKRGKIECYPSDEEGEWLCKCTYKVFIGGEPVVRVAQFTWQADEEIDATLADVDAAVKAEYVEP